MAGYDSNLSGDFVKNALIYANDMQGGSSDMLSAGWYRICWFGNLNYAPQAFILTVGTYQNQNMPSTAMFAIVAARNKFTCKQLVAEKTHASAACVDQLRLCLSSDTNGVCYLEAHLTGAANRFRVACNCMMFGMMEAIENSQELMQNMLQALVMQH